MINKTRFMTFVICLRRIATLTGPWGNKVDFDEVWSYFDVDGRSKKGRVREELRR